MAYFCQLVPHGRWARQVEEELLDASMVPYTSTGIISCGALWGR